MAMNAAGEALQWDNTYRDPNLGHANTVFYTTAGAAGKYGRAQGALGDASLILQSGNVT